MRQTFKKLLLHSSEKNYLDITPNIKDELKTTNIQNGLLNVSILHTSCSLLIQENADPSVLIDIRNFLEEIAPEKNYVHNSEGPDDMPSHLKSLLTQTHLSLSFRDNELILGTWQGIFLLEHRVSDKTREVLLHFIGD
ncbi:MAG: secondary thiamine-phosphate synthase enzyme YjbQ [Alphaproteobacteria bacterium]